MQVAAVSNADVAMSPGTYPELGPMKLVLPLGWDHGILCPAATFSASLWEAEAQHPSCQVGRVLCLGWRAPCPPSPESQKSTVWVVSSRTSKNMGRRGHVVAAHPSGKLIAGTFIRTLLSGLLRCLSPSSGISVWCSKSQLEGIELPASSLPATVQAVGWNMVKLLQVHSEFGQLKRAVPALCTLHTLPSVARCWWAQWIYTIACMWVLAASVLPTGPVDQKIPSLVSWEVMLAVSDNTNLTSAMRSRQTHW